MESRLNRDWRKRGLPTVVAKNVKREKTEACVLSAAIRVTTREEEKLPWGEEWGAGDGPIQTVKKTI